MTQKTVSIHLFAFSAIVVNCAASKWKRYTIQLGTVFRLAIQGMCRSVCANNIMIILFYICRDRSNSIKRWDTCFAFRACVFAWNVHFVMLPLLGTECIFMWKSVHLWTCQRFLKHTLCQTSSVYHMHFLHTHACTNVMHPWHTSSRALTFNSWRSGVVYLKVYGSIFFVNLLSTPLKQECRNRH